MVNITVLQKISNLFKTSTIPMKKWSQRSRVDQKGEFLSCTKAIVRKFKDVLIRVSGNDVVEMLKGKF
jgi:hypothetical protein